MNAFIEELKWRGLFSDMTPGTEDQLDKEMTKAYIGFDPTAILCISGVSSRLRSWLTSSSTAISRLHWWAAQQA